MFTSRHMSERSLELSFCPLLFPVLVVLGVKIRVLRIDHAFFLVI